MSIWFLLWFVLAVIIIGATLWSTIILIQQKQAWKSYAAKKGFNFTPNKFFEPAVMEGTMGDYTVSFFTAVEQNEDSRKNRQITVAQINANFPFSSGIGAGSPKMLAFLQALETIKPYDVDSKVWQKKNHIYVEDQKTASSFLTEARLKIINDLLSFPKANVIILLDQNEGVFRFETSNPLHDQKKIEAFVTKVIARIEKLRPSEEEAKNIKPLSVVDKPTEDIKDNKAD